MSDITNLVTAVRKHAQEHYNDGGWDVIVEACDDEWIVKAINDSSPVPTTLDEVLNPPKPDGWSVIASCVDIWADRQADARNSAF